MKRWDAATARIHHVAPYSRIFVLLNGSERVATLLDCVASWAKRGAHVRLVGLARVPSLGDRDHQAAQRFCNRITLTAMLDASCEMLALHGIAAESEVLDPGADEAVCTEALVRAVRAWEPGLTIGIPPDPVILAGNTGCPILVLPIPYARPCTVPPQRIFVASDGSSAAACAVRETARIAPRGAAVRVGYMACDPADAMHPEDFDAAVLEAEYGHETTAHAIVQAALQWHADLLVVGTRGGHAGGRWRYGSVAADVVRRTVLPLLLVPQTSKPWMLA
jgi:nucleotide-binding universal stress UspA family protein